jgi:hypothetical protein
MPGTPLLHASASRHPNPFLAESPPFRQEFFALLGADNLLDRGRTELQGLVRNSLFVMEAAAQRNGGGHERGDDDNALQTLHGFLSFG